MNRYLSTVGLYARSNFYKILLLTLTTALLAGFLVYRYPVEREVTDYYYDSDGAPVLYTYSTPALDGVVGLSRAPIVCAVGFAAITAVMSLTGCGYGVKTGYTVGRLRVCERKACLVWAVYHAALLLLYWAVLGLALYTALVLRSRMAAGVSSAVGPQSLMLLGYTDPFLHRLFPMKDFGVWAVDAASVLAVALSTVQFSHRQRRGGFSIGIFCVAACVIAAFFCPLGSNWNFALMVLLLALAGGALSVMVGGEGNAAQTV